MNANQIIRRPLVTEKTTLLREKNDNNILAFEVDSKANKIQVRVLDVRLFNVRGKIKRMGRYEGKRRDWRKAYVRLHKDDKAPDFIEGV
jgi:large subunit ribosomal protein L23